MFQLVNFENLFTFKCITLFWQSGEKNVHMEKKKTVCKISVMFVHYSFCILEGKKTNIWWMCLGI